MKKQSGTAPMSNNAEFKQFQLDKEIELRDAKRQLEIEAALEKVRSLTMVMKRSDDLSDIILNVYKELRKLDIALTRTLIWLFSENPDMFEVWLADTEADKTPFVMKQEVEHPYHKRMFDAWKKRKSKWVYINEGEGKKDLDDYLFTKTAALALPEEVKDGIRAVNRIVNSFSFHNFGCLQADGAEELSEENFEILHRFAREFDLAYTRFLDLKKAEAQAREAQIEASLERVRARSMAMHNSEELLDVAKLLYQELEDLGVPQYMTGFVEVDKINQKQKVWVTAPNGQRMESFFLPLKGDTILKTRHISWLKQDPIFYQKVAGEALKKHLLYVSKHYESNEAVEIGNQFPDTIIFYCGNFSEGYLHILSEVKLDEEQESILQRFTKVFSITYRRFLDLKLAEEQAREAKIEAALERVRSKSIGMQKSEELKEVIRIIFDQLALLDINAEHAGIVVDYKAKQDWNFWIAETQDIPSRVTIPYLDSLWDRQYVEAKEKGKDFFTTQFNFEEKNRFYQELLKYIPGLTKKARNFYLNCPGLAISTAIQDNIGLYIENFSGTPYSDDENNILMRFGKVFQQTYTRFLDLQKAEEQAREAQIEAGLERVRASTMAMHKSEQLSETAMVLFDQFYQLGQVPDRISIAIFNPSNKSFEFRVTDQSGSQLSNSYNATIEGSTTIHKIYKAWKNKEKSTVIKLTGQNLKKWIQFVKEEMKLHIDEKKIQGRRIHHAAFFSHGFLLYTSSTYMESEFITLLVRFANVFDQTYTRFLDLKKAELQAREAQIEAALERVRAQAMAMQQSDDITKSTSVLFEELEQLNLSIIRCGIGIINPKTLFAKIYSTTKTEKGENMILTGQIDLNAHPAWKESVQAWKSQELSLYVLEGDELLDYYKQLGKHGYKLPREILQSIKKLNKQYYYNAMFSHGGLYVISNAPISDENLNIIRRFTDVYNLTYTRYEDLQKAESRALEAVRQASLDRVRGVIASMRSKEDLNRITPLIWKELKALDVPFIRCGVFIMDVENETIQSYLSTPDGKTLGIFNLPFISELISELLVDYWEKGKVYKDHWTKKQFVEFMQRLKESGQLKDASSYQGAAAPPDKLDLHFIPFKQGMLYVGNTEPLSENELDLVKSLADAFSIAYARYEDFRELELAKNQIEETLNELKSTQSQLIHAEKMASLGELTAGIAHEIQNPLNFVNNFSDVSIDLIEELKDERNRKRDERDESLEREILDDVIQNLEKINHHGLRASSIVKGMLEHSRSSSKEKQLIDINALADEYLRLAYHGLRAKDKSFNADFSLEKDDKLPEIKVIPQDIGRVLLNLINNAFYAVSNKAKKGLPNFKPQVIVSTKMSETVIDKSAVEIRVKDNGNGISKNILDKIFQPFFTTKPTGSGTGLGLSLSYDIVTKGHGGKLNVESEDSKGTEFLIILPI